VSQVCIAYMPISVDSESHRERIGIP
jgi:hypothetical protein